MFGKDLVKNRHSLCLKYLSQMEEKDLSGTVVWQPKLSLASPILTGV